MMDWLIVSAVAMVITAAIHSVVGERRLIGPALAAQEGVFKNGQSRKVLRSAWHLTSLFMLITAAVMIWPRTDLLLKSTVAGVWLVVGLFSLASSNGKHVGWPTLTLAGVSGLLGTLV
jgi:hypothetical protein